MFGGKERDTFAIDRHRTGVQRKDTTGVHRQREDSAGYVGLNCLQRHVPRSVPGNERPVGGHIEATRIIEHQTETVRSSKAAYLSLAENGIGSERLTFRLSLGFVVDDSQSPVGGFRMRIGKLLDREL